MANVHTMQSMHRGLQETCCTIFIFANLKTRDYRVAKPCIEKKLGGGGGVRRLVSTPPFFFAFAVRLAAGKELWHAWRSEGAGICLLVSDRTVQAEPGPGAADDLT